MIRNLTYRPNRTNIFNAFKRHWLQILITKTYTFKAKVINKLRKIVECYLDSRNLTLVYQMHSSFFSRHNK